MILEFSKFPEVYPAFRAEDEEKKKAMMAKVGQEAAPKTLTFLAKLLADRGGEYFAGNEVSFQDFLYLFSIFCYFQR